jgi:hypothetical protein
VIWLLNCDRLGASPIDLVERLTKWVEAGGSLVIAPGDQVDVALFNRHYWQEGRGLSPLALESIQGDEQRGAWANLRITSSNYEPLQPFAGQNNPLLENLKIFRWWRATTAEGELGQAVTIAARFDDAEKSPAIAEKSLGSGRVVSLAFPMDADWTNWPSHPSYVLFVQDLIHRLARPRVNEQMLRVGEAIHQAIDLGEYDPHCVLTGPHELKADLQAAPPSGAESSLQRTVLWEVRSSPLDVPGYYKLTRETREHAREPLLFAVNVDSTEGDLRRANFNMLQRELARQGINLISAKQTTLTGNNTRAEISLLLIFLAVAILGCEQALGWFFGRRRS